MQQARQEFDWGILIVLAMSIAMAWNFIVRTDLAGGNRLEHTMFQASDIADSFDAGYFYPRWFPNAVNGYGAPIPNYYPMGTPYTIALVDVLFTDDLNQAARIVIIVSYAIAGISVYLLVSRRINASIGLVASLLYIYSPMIGSTIPYSLGDLPLLLASALMPASLWTTYRLLKGNGAFDFMAQALLAGFLLWTHPQMALATLLLTVVYILSDSFSIPRPRRVFIWGFAVFLGVISVSFFWFPALVEQHLVSWHSPDPSLSNLQLNITQLFTPMDQIDSGLLIPLPQFKIGTILMMTTIIGMFVVIVAPHIEKRFFGLFITAGIVITVVALVFLPGETWLLVPISLCFSIGGASTLTIREWIPAHLRRLILASAIAVILISTLPIWLVPSPHMTLNNWGSLAQLRYAQQGYGIATLSEELPLPATISPLRPINRLILNSYETSTPRRYDDNQNSANTIVNLLETVPHRQQYRVLNESPRWLQFLVAYFDGWQAYLDGRPIQTEANPETGLLQVFVPVTDNGELTIELIDTPVRQTAWEISFFALVILIIISFIQSRRITQRTYELVQTMEVADVRLMMVVFVTLTIFIVILTSDNPPIQLRAPPSFTLSMSLPLRNRTTVGIEATTFSIEKVNIQRGESIDLTIYWQTLTTLQNNYQTRARLRHVENRLTWYTGELQTPSNIPSRRWLRNTYIADHYSLVTNSELLSGMYQIVIEAFPCNQTCNLNEPILFFDISGNPIGNELVIPVPVNLQ